MGIRFFKIVLAHLVLGIALGIIIGLFVVTGGNAKAVPVVIAGSLLTLASMLILRVNVFANVRAAKV